MTLSETRVRILIALTDAVLYWAAMTLVTFARWETVYQLTPWLYFRDRAVCLLLFFPVLVFVGAYQSDRLLRRFDSAYYAVTGLVLLVLLQLLLVAFLPQDLIRGLSRREIILSLPAASVLIVLWRFWAVGRIAGLPVFSRCFYVVGEGTEAGRLAKELGESEGFDARPFAYDVYVADHRRRDEAMAPRHELRDEVVITPGALPGAQLQEVLAFCEEHCRRVFLYPSLSDVVLLGHENLSSLAGIPLVEVDIRPRVSPYLRVKRAMDVLVALVLLIVTAPLLAVIALAVRIGSPGPVLYKQTRLAAGGAPFTILKFRSMAVSASHPQYERADERDHRITPVGTFLRRYKLDELPQLVNVLKGEMSLVGPRPLWDTFFDRSPEIGMIWRRRLVVRPGMTSLSHVLGSSYADPGDFLRYDFVYINNISFVLDLRIILLTLRIVLSGRQKA